MMVERKSLTFAEAGWRATWLADRAVAERLTCPLENSMAIAELHRYPDQTMGIVVPDDVADTHDHEVAYTQVIRACAETALQEKPVVLRCILPEHSCLASVLQANGFQAVDRLLHWTQSTSPPIVDSMSQWQFEEFDARDCIPRDGNISSTHAAWGELLSRVLAESEDLNWAPRPCVADLLKLWGLLAGSTTLLIASQQSTPVGIAVCQSTSSLPAQTGLEYIGVHPDYRRQGLATALIRQVIDGARHANGANAGHQGDHDVRIAVTSTASNQTANAFYTNHGFEQIRSSVLWAFDKTRLM